METSPIQSVEASTQKPTLTSGFALFTQGVTFARTHIFLVIILTVLPTLITIADVTELLWTQHAILSIVVSVGIIVAIIAYFLSFVASVHFVAKAGEEGHTFRHSLAWAQTNLFRLLWIYLLVSFAVWGGVPFLIIPAAIISLTLFFSPFTFIHEEKRGLAALLRSRELTIGRRKALFWRFVTTLFFSILLTLALSIVAGFITHFLGSVLAGVVKEFVTQLAVALFTIIMTVVANTLYLECKDQPANTEIKDARTKYTLLIILGVLTMLTAAVLGSYYNDVPYELTNAERTRNHSALRSELIAASAIAEARFEESGSYEGVCESVQPLITTAETIVCNNAVHAWAIAVVSGEESWCADSTGYNKLISVSLEGRLTCLPL